MGFERIIEGGGIVISITGLLVVFAGLVLISLYIAAIPRLLGGLEQRRAQRAERRRRAAASPLPTDDPVLLAAIACAIDLEREHERLMDEQRITIRRDESQRVWTAFGQMRTLSNRL